jgi:hypothetical protein
MHKDATRQHLFSSLRFLQLAHEVVARQSGTMRKAILLKLAKSHIASFFALLTAGPVFSKMSALEIGPDRLLTSQKIVTTQDPEYVTLDKEQILTIERVKQILK